MLFQGSVRRQLMSRVKLSERVAAVEREIAKLRSELPQPKKQWLDQIYGAFANDPVYDEAMRLGREYRESLRPKPEKKREAKKSSGHPRHRSHNVARKSGYRSLQITESASV